MSPVPRSLTPGCLDPEPPTTLRVDQARDTILRALRPIRGTVMRPIRDALGATLAEDVVSPLDVPAHTNSAVDGYALRVGDLTGASGGELRIVGTARAGHPSPRSLAPGQCLQIMTGAPLPQGADAVVMQEHTQREGPVLHVHRKVRVEENVRRAGEDLSRGTIAVEAGTRLTPAHLGLIASLGIPEVAVRRPLRVAFFSTGDELRALGQPLADGAIYDSNRYTLHAMLSRLGVEPLDLGVVRDQPDALRHALCKAAACADAVVTSGGVSVGEADYVRRILDELGEVGFWKIAMKPGRPFAFGRVNGAGFFGLPGNPVAVMVTFAQFVRPALRYMIDGRPPPDDPTFEAICMSRLRKKPGRTEFHRGILAIDGSGNPTVRSAGAQGSGILRTMAQADCFVILPHEGGSVEPGDRVRVQPFSVLT